MPTNLFGPHDNYDLETSHVVGALMVKIHRAKLAGAASVEIWGSGTPRREFLHVDDCADACVFLLENYDEAGIVNIGVGSDVTIAEFAETLARVIGWSGRFEYDRSRPDGTPRKMVATGRINALGWRARIGLEEGLRSAYAWFLANAPEARPPA
jgi:GDP-L-fucose synthase